MILTIHWFVLIKFLNNLFRRPLHQLSQTRDKSNVLIININEKELIIFYVFEPLVGWRHVEVTERRTQIDYAQQMKYLVDDRYPKALKIRIVQDNLNTHIKASLKAFLPSEAKRIADKLEFHYTPKHGSWLNMAEIELSVLAKQMS
ncbi:MAG: hypothetical protein N5P05_002211 [Chroococcopsis gigantea SAG 12.99]|nr:hypothetical protein [Chroococcopsis gigantea SAG 12.99]